MATPRILPSLLKRLKYLRKRAGLTQEQFAKRAGMGYKFYQQLEAGRKRDMRLSTLERLAKAHKIKVSQLLTGE
jgi:transcriptional regulator with XRE-family HTH domain